MVFLLYFCGCFKKMIFLKNYSKSESLETFRNILFVRKPKLDSALMACPLSLHSTAERFPGAAEQTDSQLSAHLQDASTLRLV